MHVSTLTYYQRFEVNFVILIMLLSETVQDGVHNSSDRLACDNIYHLKDSLSIERDKKALVFLLLQ